MADETNITEAQTRRRRRRRSMMLMQMALISATSANNTSETPTDGPFMDFSDTVNSMYVALLGDE